MVSYFPISEYKTRFVGGGRRRPFVQCRLSDELTFPRHRPHIGKQPAKHLCLNCTEGPKPGQQTLVPKVPASASNGTLPRNGELCR